MQSENFDKKVQEAAEHHHPAYEEKAWEKMEKLLDKHLPQKDDNRRRFIFFLLLFFLLGGGAWLIIDKPWETNKQATEASRKNDDNKTLPESVTTHTSGNETSNHQTIPGETNSQSDGTETVKTTNNNPDIHTTENVINNRIEPGKKDVVLLAESKQGTKRKRTEPVQNVIQKDEPYKKPVEEIKNNTTDPVAGKKVNDKIDNTIPPVQPEDKIVEQKTDKPVKKDADKKESMPLAQTKTEKKTKDKSKKNSFLFFTLSAGPDVSVAGSDKLGKTKLLAGLGVGYTFNDRFTVRTGFYSARKVYSASPSEYKAPPEFYIWYPYLEKVNADCKVFEIPVSFSYNFGQTSKQNWFASAGLSSYLMKRETYDYYYKYYPTSPTLTATRTIRDENTHLFSVLNLSGGYQRNIGKTFSLTVEPYVKLPLSGVGYGKVKLNSGGILFTLGIKPFQAKNDKPVKPLSIK